MSDPGAGTSPVAVAFRTEDPAFLHYERWPGTAHGAFAVVAVQPYATMPATLRARLPYYQLVHRASGYYVVDHDRAEPLVLLARRLNALEVTWPGADATFPPADPGPRRARRAIAAWRRQLDRPEAAGMFA